MENPTSLNKRSVGRRSFLKRGILAGGAAIGAGMLNGSTKSLGQSSSGGSLTKGDIAILRFVAAAELLETDLWQQYAELGGITNGPMNTYQAAFQNLDPDGLQYITSNTNDELSHAQFLNAYLESKGAEPVDLDRFRTLQGSRATGAQNIGRLTNLMNLNVDTSWFIRYRSTTNPDLGATFPQAITITNRTSIPITDADFNNANHIQVIANTAAFHFGTIEQGGSSLYASLSRKVTSEEVLEITLGIGADEVAHFLEWVTSPATPFNRRSRPYPIKASNSLTSSRTVHSSNPTLSSLFLANSLALTFLTAPSSAPSPTNSEAQEPQPPS